MWSVISLSLCVLVPLIVSVKSAMHTVKCVTFLRFCQNTHKHTHKPMTKSNKWHLHAEVTWSLKVRCWQSKLFTSQKVQGTMTVENLPLKTGLVWLTPGVDYLVVNDELLAAAEPPKRSHWVLQGGREHLHVINLTKHRVSTALAKFSVHPA